jgi:dienelactone hydrolase
MTTERRYDPFVRGTFPVGVRTVHAHDTARERLFPCEIWYPATARHAGEDVAPPTQDSFTVESRGQRRAQQAVRDAAAQPGTYPLVLYSHPSAGHRRAATFLCTHLASHGYVVAALDHSELLAPELAPREGETAEERRARGQGWIANRVPDVRFLLDHLLDGGGTADPQTRLDHTRIGIVGHSFGGWTALAVPADDPRISAVVALAPAGSSRPRPGVLPVTLTFAWGRDVPTLYLAADQDVPVPLASVVELFERTPATKRMLILHRADHQHFMDDVEGEHEAVRAMTFTGDLAWMTAEMRPITELCSGASANLFVRGLALSHLDTTLRSHEDAQRFLAGDVDSELLARGVEATSRQP